MTTIQTIAYLFAVQCLLGVTWLFFTDKAKSQSEKDIAEQKEPETIDDKTLESKLRLIYRKIYFIDRK